MEHCRKRPLRMRKYAKQEKEVARPGRKPSGRISTAQKAKRPLQLAPDRAPSPPTALQEMAFLAWRLRQAIVDGKQCQLKPAGDPDLVENVGQVMFDRVFTERETACDFFVAQPGDDGGQNVHLAFGKAVVARLLLAGRIGAQEFDNVAD